MIAGLEKLANADLEQKLLVGLIHNVKENFGATLHIDLRDFFYDNHRKIYEMLCTLRKTHKRKWFESYSDFELLGLNVVKKALKKAEMPEEEYAFLEDTKYEPDREMSREDLEGIMSDLRGLLVRRELITVVEEIRDVANTGEQTIEEVAAFISERFADIDALFWRISPIGDLLQGVLDRIESRKEDTEREDSLMTGLQDLDRTTGDGLYPGLTVFACRWFSPEPKMGESELAVNIACRAAMKGKHVIYFSTNEEEKNRLTAYLESTNTKLDTLDIIYNPTLEYEDLLMQRERKLDLIVMDDATHLNEKAKEMDEFARELKIPIIAVATCSKEGEKFDLDHLFRRYASTVYRFYKLKKYRGGNFEVISIKVRQRTGLSPTTFRLVYFPGTYKFRGFTRRQERDEIEG